MPDLLDTNNSSKCQYFEVCCSDFFDRICFTFFGQNCKKASKNAAEDFPNRRFRNDRQHTLLAAVRAPFHFSLTSCDLFHFDEECHVFVPIFSAIPSLHGHSRTFDRDHFFPYLLTPLASFVTFPTSVALVGNSTPVHMASSRNIFPADIPTKCGNIVLSCDSFCLERSDPLGLNTFRGRRSLLRVRLGVRQG